MNNSVIFLYLSFPILFMFHELEEIAYINEWIHIWNLEKMRNFIKNKNLPTNKNFTLMVLEEYFIIIIVGSICYMNSYDEFYVSVIIAYNIHILGHIIQALYLRSYVPGLILGVISLIILSIILSNYIIYFDWRLIVMFVPLTSFLLVFNLFLIHKYIH